ncbi:hypothetical protein [Seonamhaeicola marinus]|uniref:Uncharacterized protein n=1 Tax=Seonamhaeicola marinus TaxID=1912246 RepID=A0A5D0JUG2_9FLAO|nr:hypothetical protein [Seonamhaeicola marinus]TYA97872.1 hypothetical protein FUA24_00060 [Seonamhaeicola marinus]
MTTTQVFIELLITGFGTLAWIILIILGINGFDFSFLLQEEMPSILLLPITGLAYILGIIVDRIGFQIFKKKERKNIKKIFSEEDNNDSIKLKVVYIIQKSDHLKSAIDYNRSRLRLARSWIINFLMITVSLLLYCLVNLDKRPIVFLSLSIFSLIFCFLSFYTWSKLSSDYYKNIKSSYESLKSL